MQPAKKPGNKCKLQKHNCLSRYLLKSVCSSFVGCMIFHMFCSAQTSTCVFNSLKYLSIWLLMRTVKILYRFIRIWPNASTFAVWDSMRCKIIESNLRGKMLLNSKRKFLIVLIWVLFEILRLQLHNTQKVWICEWELAGESSIEANRLNNRWIRLLGWVLTFLNFLIQLILLAKLWNFISLSHISTLKLGTDQLGCC